MRPGSGPLYRQVKQRVIRNLIDETWRPGDMLPSEPRLAESLGVSPGTVRRALDELVVENVLVRHQGKGTIVRRQDPDRSLFHFFRLVDLAGVRPTPRSHVMACRRRRGTAAELGRLALPAGATIVAIERTRSLGAAPVLVERIVLPARLFADLHSYDAATLPNTLYTLYQERYGVSVYRAVEDLSAVAATAHDAELLAVPAATPLLEIDRLGYTLNDVPVEWRVSRCRTEAHRYRVDLS